MTKYTARSASDKTDDWQFWMVCNREGLNITNDLICRHINQEYKRDRLPFMRRENAESLAQIGNRAE